MKKRILTSLLSAAMIFTLLIPALAVETGFTDVPSEAWYSEAIKDLYDKGIMTGTGNNTFSPNGVFTRGHMAAVLYRMAGEPAVSGDDSFPDTQAGQWYSNAVLWCSQQGVINGYKNGSFGVNDPVKQQQVVTILWRDAGEYVVEGEGTSYSNASPYAVNALRWAEAEEMFTDNVQFEPQKEATRAQVADLVSRYLVLKEKFSNVDAVTGATSLIEEGETTEDETTSNNNILVAYFSATNNTKSVAEKVAAVTDGTLYTITPVVPYTSQDINYNDSNSRTTIEQNDASARPEIVGTIENMEDYDIIFLGYPIWWGQAPKIMYTFIERYDLEGKTIVPFCTSASSPIGTSATNMQTSASNANWLPGIRFSAAATESNVIDWVNSLNLETTKR